MNAIVDGFQNIVQSFSDAIFLAVIKDDRYQYLLDGLKMSLLLTVIAAGIGVVIGMLLAIAKLQDLDNLSGSRFMNGCAAGWPGFANGYISVVRGTPAVVQLMVIYFIIFGRLFQGVLEGYQVAALGLRHQFGGLCGRNYPRGHHGRGQGADGGEPFPRLSGGKTMLFIVIPQAVKNVLPALGNEFIVLLKETSVAGYIGIADLTKGAQTIGSVTYDYIVPLLCAAYIYFLMTTTLATGLNKIERRMRRSD